MAFKSEDSCAICLQSLEQPGLGRQALECGHVFHEQCVMQMRRQSTPGSCPLCRREGIDTIPVDELSQAAFESYRGKQYVECFQVASLALEVQPQHAHMNVLLGELYLKGKGVPVNVDYAIELLEEGCRQEQPFAWGLLANAFLMKGKFIHARRCMQEGYVRGDFLATTLLSLFCASQGDASAAEELKRQCHDSWAPEFEKHFTEMSEEGKDAQKDPDWASGWLGSRVIVDGLTSSAGLQLNGRFGTVVKYDSSRHRFGVEVDGIGLKSLKLENVIIENVPHIVAEFSRKQAASQSTPEGSSSALGDDVLGRNAQVSQALLAKVVEEPERFVVLLKFERNPAKFLEVLMSSEVLAPYRKELESQGLAVVLPSRAKIFVHPLHYEAVLEAIEKQELQLYADHVIIEPDLETHVVEILKRIVKPKHRGRKTIALEFGQDSENTTTEERQLHEADEKQSQEAKDSSSPFTSRTSPTLDLPVRRTFIHFSVPNSLYTPSSKTQAKTA